MAILDMLSAFEGKVFKDILEMADIRHWRFILVGQQIGTQYIGIIFHQFGSDALKFLNK